jgi:1-acyl-sn-glycerol-3-phosphate acyltransferase
MFNFIRSSVFTIFFILWSVFVFVVFIPVLFFPPKYVILSAKLWAWGTIAGARWLMGIRLEVRGQEHVPENGRYIIACNHQSAYETVVFYLLCDWACYVFKKELSYIPLFGWYTMRTRSVRVNRSGGMSAINSLKRQTKMRIDEGRQVVVFPGGTRVKYGEKEKYQPGVAAMYSACDVPVVPVAHDAGKCWPKNSWIKYPGTITFRYLPPIEPGLKRAEFMKQLETRIQDACEVL